MRYFKNNTIIRIYPSPTPISPSTKAQKWKASVSVLRWVKGLCFLYFLTKHLQLLSWGHGESCQGEEHLPVLSA